MPDNAGTAVAPAPSKEPEGEQGQVQDGKTSSKQSNAAPAPAAQQKELYPMVNWKYDLFLYTVGNIVDMFFREVVPRGAWRVPQSGPVLFVAAPHANQVCLSGCYLGRRQVTCFSRRQPRLARGSEDSGNYRPSYSVIC